MICHSAEELSSKSSPRLHDALTSLAEPFNNPLLRGGQFRAVFNFDGDAVVMFDDAGESKAEHLPVYVIVILGNDTVSGQVLLADFMVPPAGLALHAARLGSVRVEIIAMNWHGAGELGTKRGGRQDVAD